MTLITNLLLSNGVLLRQAICAACRHGSGCMDQHAPTWLMSRASPDSNAANLACLPVVIFPLIHLAPSFDADQHAGVGGASLRANVERYDFASRHIALKTAGFALDQFLYAHNETGLLLLYGDAKAARQGWAKQIDAWARIQRLVASGEQPRRTSRHGRATDGDDIRMMRTVAYCREGIGGVCDDLQV